MHKSGSLRTVYATKGLEGKWPWPLCHTFACERPLWLRITQEVRGVMPLRWLCYRQSDRIEIAIVRGASLMHARLRAALDGIDADATFAEGRKLDAERAAWVRPGYLGRMLSREEAAGLLYRIGRGPKSPGRGKRR
jgi:hypothetical protein